MKCGIITIGIFTLLLIATNFAEIFYMLLNDYIHWWYVLVALLLLVPTIIAATFFIAFFNKDTHTTRGLVRTSCILVIISYSLLAVWNIVYFNSWYKNPDVYIGSSETGYFKQTKKQYVFYSILFAICIDGLYAYFICVNASYKKALKHEAEENKDKAEEKKE